MPDYCGILTLHELVHSGAEALELCMVGSRNRRETDISAKSIDEAMV